MLYSLIPPVGKEYLVTIIEAVNETGVPITVIDGVNHVSVRPRNPMEYVYYIFQNDLWDEKHKRSEDREIRGYSEYGSMNYPWLVSLASDLDVLIPGKNSDFLVEDGKCIFQKIVSWRIGDEGKEEILGYVDINSDSFRRIPL